MFSIFKFLQNTLKNLKSNKGLWFTTLAVLSVTGIFLCLYILTNLTQNASKEVYSNITTNYMKNYKNRVLKKEESFKKILLTVESDTGLVTDMGNDDLISVEKKIAVYNDKFTKAGFNTLQIAFYQTLNQVNQYRNSINSVISSKSKTFGIEVLQEGIYYVYINPIIKDDKLIGIFELREEVHEFKAEYARDDIIFLFLLEEKMLNQLSIKARNGKYREVIDTVYVEELKYDGQFFAKIIESEKEGYKNMLEIGYSVDDTYFRAAQKISDINGNIIGVIVIGERVEGSGAFVNIVDSMTKTVTTVALGLVISILLFMF